MGASPDALIPDAAPFGAAELPTLHRRWIQRHRAERGHGGTRAPRGVGRRAREGIDALVVHPRLVQTNLDLVDFPSVCWPEVDYSVYVMRQASRRSWRIGQRLPVDVTFFAYAGTLQAEALG